MGKKQALIIGAGPAGLTAALELARRTDIHPLVLEQSEHMGGISRTVQYKGNRIDIGGHRFFSKSDRIMNWWTEVMPVQKTAEACHDIFYRRQSRSISTHPKAPDPANDDCVMLIRNRKSRIYFLRQFFEYPIRLTPDTLGKLGWLRTARIGFSYARSMMRPVKPEVSLEDFFINHFGRELYLTFFKSYTEKVWGEPCCQISAEWGAQRIKGLSVRSAVRHFLRSVAARERGHDVGQKSTETSLIEKFMYPKLGPGQLWDYVAADLRRQGGCVQTGWSVDRIHTCEDRVVAATATHVETGLERTFEADYFFSTMPVKELVASLDAAVPVSVAAIAAGLEYRDFITVGLLLNRLRIHDKANGADEVLKDNWIYIQESDVSVGRMQIFNNWSPWMVRDPSTVWIGLEYFCRETDPIWRLPDPAMIELAGSELEKIGIIDQDDILDACVIRVPKAYPAYFGSYKRFAEVREYIDRFENLFLIGRNGMHKYNNQDHSMLTAMTAVDNIIAGRMDKSNVWAVNTETEYHESRSARQAAAAT